MTNNWTPAQRDAIDARGMQVLVSAAAGSGKTTVLTERVKNILADTEDPCHVSELLVVTFTKAAANEMRDRIFNALKESVDIRKDNSDYLRRQMMLLPTADICTMDSFCAKIVKGNFSAAGVGCDFRFLDNKEVDEITSRAIEQVIDELYEENDAAFSELISMFIGEKNDNLLKDSIIQLYNFSLSYPFPDEWLESLCDSFDSAKEPNETLWANIIYKYIGMFADFHRKRLLKCVSMMEESGGFNPDFVTKFVVSAEKLGDLLQCVELKSWDAMITLIREGLVSSSSGRNTKVDVTLKEFVMSVFKEFSEDVSRLEKHTFPLSDEHKKDSSILYPVVSKLCKAVKRLGDIQNDIKNEMNAYAFTDILHKCIDLFVVSKGDGEWERTVLCDSLMNKYKEILIDEYQDTNDAQNMLFEAISRNKSNLYVVGDVKQSIYRFRLASPSLFMKLKNETSDYDGSNKPSQINLDSNFRSRRGVDDAVNYIFGSLMSEDVGDVDYDDKEKLKFGADWYPQKSTPDTEILCVDCGNLKSSEVTVTEAEVVADYINKLVSSGVVITTKDGDRPIRYGDICVLMRSVKDRVDHYVNSLKKRGIPYCTVTDGDVSDCKEMRVMISLVKVVSNPTLEIPLISVMVSPLFGFTADELAEIRMIDRNDDFYNCLVRYSTGNSKARRFLDKLRLYRNIASSYPVDEFVRFIVDDMGVADIYRACESGDMRKANIYGFVKLAEDFVKNSGNGLNAFVRYVDDASERGYITAAAESVSTDGVKFMSIHKSKGLEFPYVIIAGCSKGFNKQDSYGSLVLARETGIGLKIRDDNSFTKYHTVSSAGTELATLYGSASEELRVLYVAMTRAKEHITFICSLSGSQLGKRVGMNNVLSVSENGKLHPFAVFKANSMSEWVLTCFARHSECSVIRDALGFKLTEEKEEDFHLDCSFLQSVEGELAEQEQECESAPVNEALLNEISEKLSFEYQYKCEGILAKRTASSTENNGIKREYFASSKPDFLKDKLSGADKGTAIHKFFEICDFKNARSDVESEKKRLLQMGYMTEKELSVINDSDIKKFVSNKIVERMLCSDKILREYEFSVIKKAGEMYPDVSENIKDEDIVVQGKLDCAFFEKEGAVLIDYKSDNITDENTFVEIYKPQIDVYSEALSLCCGIRVKERYIYSLKLGKFISL